MSVRGDCAEGEAEAFAAVVSEELSSGTADGDLGRTGSEAGLGEADDVATCFGSDGGLIDTVRTGWLIGTVKGTGRGLF